MSTPLRTYPAGVPCWIDTERDAPRASAAFYGELLGWDFTEATPPEAEFPYLIATLDDEDAAAVTGPADDGPDWITYIATDDIDACTRRIADAGGEVVVPLQEIGPAGRLAVCTDPSGAQFRLWQANLRLGAQIVNVPGAWNFSILDTPDPGAALEFYSAVFGWTSTGSDAALGDLMVAMPGYGQHLADTVDPGILERQAGGPEGFANVVAGIGPSEQGASARWRVQFSVADRDTAIATADRLGATVISTRETNWTREALIRDPDGAVFTASEFIA